MENNARPFPPVRRRRRRRSNARAIALLLAIVLTFGVAVGGTIAWLTDKSEPVTNTFSKSGIDITLTETDTDENTEGVQHDYKMIPGWTITKDPKVAVVGESEDCWLFVKITESTTPDLNTYITYAIAEGWTPVDDGDDNEDTIVIGRKVYKDDATKQFDIIGYTDTKGTTDTTDDEFVPNTVLVNSDVTESLMDAISTNKPTLTFKAYAVQLFKTNNDGVKDNTTDEFTAAEAWAKAAAMDTTP